MRSSEVADAMGNVDTVSGGAGECTGKHLPPLTLIPSMGVPERLLVFATKTDEFRTKNDGFCTRRYGFYTKNDGFCRRVGGPMERQRR